MSEFILSWNQKLAVVIAAILQHRSPLALGNIIGSSISNILGAFSLGLLFQSAPGVVGGGGGGTPSFDATANIYTALTFLVTTVAVGIVYFDVLNPVMGGVLVAGFAIYIASIAYAIYRGVTIPVSDSDSESEDSESDSDSGIGDDNAIASETSPLLHPIDPTTGSAPTRRRRRRSLIYHITQLLIGLIALSLSGYILSHSASSIAESLNLSGTVFGVTILSFATTLPEKLVAVLSGARGHGSIMVASTAGSNIFLLTLCLGVVAITSGMPGSPSSGDKVVMFELGVAWASAALFLLIVLFGGGRVAGVGLVGAYVAFLGLDFTVYRR
jgi:Ca2+/Na+ antiporter